jgi:vitamin B12 transporter
MPKFSLQHHRFIFSLLLFFKPLNFFKMEKKRKVWAITLIVLWWLAPSKTSAQQSQDSVRTLNEVVITGTKFELPVEKSGKFILRLSEQQLR